MTLTRDDLKVGRVFEAKRPARCGGYLNDRQIIWVGILEVQYDGPAVANGRHYPKVTIEQFLKWAGRDVTDQMPADLSWRTSDHDRPPAPSADPGAHPAR